MSLRRKSPLSGAHVFRAALALAAGVLPAALIVLLAFLAVYSWPAIKFNGWRFLTGNTWNIGNLYADPVPMGKLMVQPGAQFSIAFLIGGTLLTTLIAIAIALPVGVASALFLAEAVPGRVRSFVSFFVELLAAVPSVVFGLWGYAVLIPFLGHHLFPLMTRHLGWLPYFRGDPGSGYGLLTAGLVLSLMIVPLISATVRDAILAQPTALRESAAALGATRFETAWKVLLPGVRRVIFGATILALGRALGETMAVLMVSGNALGYLPRNIYSPVSTMAAFIASQLDSALDDPSGLAVQSLAEIALVLAFISLVVNAAARIVLAAATRSRRTSLA
ncbi:MAG: phosphate ABC transporter permease subunit PstC [Alphaproteobacteria bacterium]|nr:phosphate ABC transporter permease subunit PstC [Alphaproteobacteria bacterium]